MLERSKGMLIVKQVLRRLALLHSLLRQTQHPSASLLTFQMPPWKRQNPLAEQMGEIFSISWVI